MGQTQISLLFLLSFMYIYNLYMYNRLIIVTYLILQFVTKQKYVLSYREAQSGAESGGPEAGQGATGL